MYEELINGLRCQNFGNCSKCPMRYENRVEHDVYDVYEVRCAAIDAADAIEELSGLCASQSKDCSEAVAKYLELWAKQPRWIPVTERLPFAESGDVSEKVLVTDGQDMAIAEWFNFEMFEPYWSYTGMGDITHWMPLPQPPKEES